jgi:spermidine synthase
VAAVVLEVSVGLLLYADEGLLPALTLILTVEMGALGLGLWSGSLTTSDGWVEQVRRRWLFSLVILALGAAVAAGLDAAGDGAGTGVGQGIGLGFLGGLPLFAIGALLGAMVEGGRDPGPSLPGVATPAVLGAALGFLLAGTVLIPNVAPYSLYLFCLVLLSGGALVHGWVLDGRMVRVVLASVPGPTGELRVERRAVGASKRDLMVLLEAGRLRGAEDREGRPGRKWEQAILQLFEDSMGEPGSCLFLGGGSGTMPRLLAQRYPGIRMGVVERTEGLVSLARRYFQPWEGFEELNLTIGDPLRAADQQEDPFFEVVLDAGALPTLGRLPFLRTEEWQDLISLTAPRGRVFLGGIRPFDDDGDEWLRGVLEAGERWFDSARAYVLKGSSASGDLLPEPRGTRELLLVLSREDAAPIPDSFAGFSLDPGASRAPQDEV